MKRLLAALLVLAAANFASAQAPSLMSYQGRVSDASGTLIGNTSPVNRLITFKFYTTSTGGTPLYVEAQTVTISAGEFSVLLGNGTGVSGFHGPSAPATTPYITIPSIMTGTVYLGITVDDGTSAADPEIAPRQQIVSAAYAFRAKTAEALLDNSLTTSMLRSSSVTTSTILDANITTSKIADGNVTTSKLLDGSVTNAKLLDGSVTNSKLGGNVVTSDKIVNLTIITDDIADNAITSAKIVDGTITGADIADGTIGSADLAANAIGNAKIADGQVTFNKLDAGTQWALCPTGSIMAYAGDNAPSGWAMCDGALLSRAANPNLFSAVGTRFGSTASDNFRLPDLRGQFLRGRDNNSGHDPDRASRTAMNPGGSVGDAVGSVQGHQVVSHAHGYTDIYHSENNGTITVPNNRGSGDTDSDNKGYEIARTSSAAGGNETRPINVYVNYIIKL